MRASTLILWINSDEDANCEIYPGPGWQSQVEFQLATKLIDVKFLFVLSAAFLPSFTIPLSV